MINTYVSIKADMASPSTNYSHIVALQIFNFENYWSKQLRHGIKIDGAKRQCEKNECKRQLASCNTYTQ